MGHALLYTLGQKSFTHVSKLGFDIRCSNEFLIEKVLQKGRKFLVWSIISTLKPL